MSAEVAGRDKMIAVIEGTVPMEIRPTIPAAPLDGPQQISGAMNRPAPAVVITVIRHEQSPVG